MLVQKIKYSEDCLFFDMPFIRVSSESQELVVTETSLRTDKPPKQSRQMTLFKCLPPQNKGSFTT